MLRRTYSSSQANAAGSLQLINSRLKPPLSAAACIIRADLINRLDDASRRRLVLFSAPTGSGKSTLLTHWYRQQHASRSIAWLSLDEQDNEPVRFFSYLIGAVRSVVRGFNAYIASRRDHDDGPLIESVTAIFSEQLHLVDQDLVIVIDDCQFVTSPLLARAIDFLVRRSPQSIHWIISGRCIPDVNISQLRLDDEFTLFGAQDLSFDSSLVLQLSRKLSRRALSVADADFITERTEGWVAGVKLALLAREEACTSGNVLQAAAGSHFEVADYLGGSVLQEQTEEVRAFLLSSCIVDRMTGELCDALLGISCSQSLLERLERAQLFIQPLDGHRHWFRYHTLFLDFLRSRLRRDDAARLPVLHERASRWYAEHQFFDDALKHAFAAKNIALRNELLARCFASWLQNGEIADVLRWTEQLSREEIVSDFSIGRSCISALILSRRFIEAAAILRIFRAAVGRNESDNTPLEILEAMYAILADDADPHAFDQHLLRAEGVDIFLGGTLLTLQAYALLRRNKFDLSRRLAMQARDMLGHASSYGRSYAEVVIALTDRAQGDMKLASDRCEQTFAEVRTGRRSPAWVNAATPVAYVRYEENRLTEAEALCLEILPLLSGASTIENFTTTYITLARIKSASRSTAEASQLLDHLHSVLEGGAHHRFQAQVWSEKILLCLREMNLAGAMRLARDWELERRAQASEFTQPRTYDEAWERAGSAYAQLLLHTHRYDEARSILTTLRDSAAEAGYVYRQIRLEAALACCLGHAGHCDESFDALNRAIALTRGYGFTRGVFDEVPSLTPLIKLALEHHRLRYSLPFHYLRKFQNLFAAREPSPQASVLLKSTALPLEPLTDRELEILKLLGRGLSNLQISTQSQIALSTAKWHLKNVFAKLDVSTRTGALARGRELKLID